MTWEQFELTGAVEDYLLYKGIDWKSQQRAVSLEKERTAFHGETGHGTVDNGDRHGTGRVRLR